MVYINKLDKNIYPYYIPPEEDELFSSWICRLAYKHQIKTNTFFMNYLDNNSIWSRDIDLLTPEDIINKIEQHTPLSKYAINQMFLKYFESYAFENINPKSSSKYILSLGIQHRTRKCYGQQCCTKCLSKENPHYKKNWRLVTSILCTECNRYLIDRCFHCQAPISFFRINMGGNIIKSTMNFEPMYLCFECKIDLRKYVPEIYPSLNEIKYQKHINETITRGYNQKTMYSFSYISILLSLATRMRADTLKSRFKNMMESIFQKSFESYNDRLHLWDVIRRIETLPYVDLLLQEEPDKLKALLFKHKVCKSYLIKDKHIMPYWFESLLHY